MSQQMRSGSAATNSVSAFNAQQNQEGATGRGEKHRVPRDIYFSQDNLLNPLDNELSALPNQI
jgi:hypothetical protein